MNKNLDRRDFEKRASVGVGGLLTGALLGSGHSAGQGRDMSDKRLVLLGLNALARAHESDYFADGHRGAGMVAAHLLCVDNNTVGIGHVFKYPYSYYDLLRRARDPELRRALDAKAYHLF
jgi:hypothetical protein